MPSSDQPWYRGLLACPDCRGDLVLDSEVLRCNCGYTRSTGGQLDLRPISPRATTLSFDRTPVDTTALAAYAVGRPENTYSGPKPIRDSSELFSAIRSHLSSGATFLDLGCGPRDQAAVANHFELKYVGVDYSAPEADILADAHALPFKDGSFDVVFSYAVLEHVQNPFVAAHEIARLLRPGGFFVGTVSQGEPFHNSFFHHTAWGLLSLFQASNLDPVRVWYSYDTLRALAGMGRYPRVARAALGILDRLLEAAPVLSPRKHFRWTLQEKELDALHRAGSICFVARKGGGAS